MISSTSAMSSYHQGRRALQPNTSAEGADVEFETRSLPNLLVATLVTLPSMSLIPSAPFPICGNRKRSGPCNREKILLCQGSGGTSVVVQAPQRERQRAFTRCIQRLPTWSIMHHKPLMMRAETNGNSKFVSARRQNQHAMARALPCPDFKQPTLQTSSENDSEVWSGVGY